MTKFTVKRLGKELCGFGNYYEAFEALEQNLLSLYGPGMTRMFLEDFKKLKNKKGTHKVGEHYTIIVWEFEEN